MRNVSSPHLCYYCDRTDTVCVTVQCRDVLTNFMEIGLTPSKRYRCMACLISALDNPDVCEKWQKGVYEGKPA